MRKHIFLSITEKCNLHCVYCFETSKRPEVMSFEKAIEIIENEMHSEGIDQLDIDFMGGEPFLEFERIKEICEYVWEREWPIKYKFTAATNGTLVKGEIQEWLEQHKEQFLCFLSIDGIKVAHDLNRTNSYDRIDISFFRRTWPNKKAKMVCSKQTIQYLFESVKHLHDLGFPDIELKLAYSFDWRDQEELQELLKQFNMLADYYIENPQLHPVSLLGIDLLEINHTDKPIAKWCTCGTGTRSYDMSGELYPCRYFQDLVRYKKVQYEDIWKVDYDTIQEQLKGRCRRCLLRDVCRTCYAYNMDVCGDYGIKNDYSCTFTKMAAYYSARIVLGRQSDGGDSSEELIRNAKKIIEAYENNSWFI